GIIGVVIASVAFSSAGSAAASGSAEGVQTGAVATILGPIIGMALYNLVEAITGASVGKMILGLVVANQDGTQGDISLFMKRWAIKNIGYIFTILSIWVTALYWVGSLGSLIIFIGCFMALGAEKLTLHDKIANTAVYKKSDVK
ncbi:MAG: RDD family protein, partial [Crocinitomicaceae bacterium]